MRGIIGFCCLAIVAVNSNVLPVKEVKLPATAISVSGCVHQGKHYPLGSFEPSPCEHCQCTSSGRAYCAIVDCFVTPCVDAVHDPTKCCPQCPNGRNCKAPDGTIIKYGETYHPDANTACSCDTHAWGSTHALCAVKIPEPFVVS